MKNANQTLTETESFQLLARLQNTFKTEKQYNKGLRNFTLAVLMLDAGLRVGEVTQLLISDLVFGDKPVTAIVVRSAIAKGHVERTIPTTLRIRDALESMYEVWWSRAVFGIDTPAFCQKNISRGITTRQVERIIKAASRIAINREVRPHQLRHTFATRLMKKANIRIVQELLGHKHLTSTQIYCHPQMEDLKNAIDGIDTEKPVCLLRK